MGTDKVDFAELLSKSTVRDNLPLSVTGNFPSEEEAQKLLYTVFGFAKVFGSVFDLTALDGITVADDYVAALGAIDRGYPGMRAATPTRDEFGAGFAMAVPVLRDGMHKSHVVLDSALVRHLVNSQSEYYASRGPYVVPRDGTCLRPHAAKQGDARALRQLDDRSPRGSTHGVRDGGMGRIYRFAAERPLGNAGLLFRIRANLGPDAWLATCSKRSGEASIRRTWKRRANDVRAPGSVRNLLHPGLLCHWSYRWSGKDTRRRGSIARNRVARDHLVQYALGAVYEHPSIHVRKNRSMGRRAGLRSIERARRRTSASWWSGFCKTPDGSLFRRIQSH